LPNQLSQSKASEEGKEMGNFLMNDQETGLHQPAFTSEVNLLSENHISVERNVEELPIACEDTKDVSLLDENEGFMEVFKVFDVNQDGVICKQDIKAIFAKLKEGHSDASISNMIENFNQSENAEQVIQFSTFKRNVSSKIKNPFTEDDLHAAFQKVLKISDGIRILGSDSKQTCEILNIETIVEALNSEIIGNIGNLNKAELMIVFDEMIRDGITQGLTFEEFSCLIKEYATDCFLMFGALLTSNHKAVHNECAESQEDGIRILNVDGTLANPNSNINSIDASMPEVKYENPKRKLENTLEVADTLSLEEEEIDMNDWISDPCPEKQAKTDLI